MVEHRPHILQLVAGMDIGGAYGGAERFGLELSRHLNRDLFDISVCAFWRRGTKQETQWYKRLRGEGINAFFAAELTGKMGKGAYPRGIRRVARHCIPPVDIVHSHFAMGGLIAIFLRVAGYTRFAVRTVHTIPLDWGLGITGWTCRQIFQRWLLPLFLDAEIGVSQAMVNELRRHPGARLTGKQPHFIPNGISMDLNNSQKRTFADLNLPFDEGTLIVGSIGRLSEEKGYVHLIEALPTVLAEFPNIRLVLIGDGNLRGDLEQRARQLEVHEKILFSGQREDASNLLKSMDVFVLPSLMESLPTVVLESMACGVPVVATDLPGTRELIQHGMTGWLVSPKNSLELAQAIIRLLQDSSLRTRLASRARDLVVNFSLKNIAVKYALLYRGIMSGRRQHSLPQS